MTNFTNANNASATIDNSLLCKKLMLATTLADIAIWEIDLNSKTLVVNDAFYNQFNEDKNVAKNYDIEKWKSFVHPDDLKRLAGMVNKALKNNSTFNVRFRVVTRQNEEKFLHTTGFINRTEQSASVIGTIQNVTDAVKNEQALRDNELRYRSFFDNSVDSIVIADSDNNVIAANAAACRMFNMNQQQLCNTGVAGLFADIDVLSMCTVKTVAAAPEVTGLRSDGSSFPAEVTASFFPASNGRTQTALVVRDLTNLYTSQRELLKTTAALNNALGELQNIMDFAQDLICTLDKNGRFVQVSKSSESILGYTPGELLGNLCADYIVEEDVAMTYEIGARILEGQAVSRAFENHYRRKDGAIIPMLWSAKWDERNEQMYCIGKDISEREAFEKKLENERKLLGGMFAEAPAALGIIKGPEHVFEFVNPLLEKILHRTDIIGKTVKAVAPEIEEQGMLTLLDNIYATGESIYEKELPVKLQATNQREELQMFFDVLFQPYKNNQGSIEGILIFSIDVTEKVRARLSVQASEDRYKKLIENLPAAVYTTNADGDMELYNKAAISLWGGEPDANLCRWCMPGKLFYTDGQPVKPQTSPVALALKHQDTSGGVELVLEQLNGNRRTVVLYPQLVLGANNSVCGSVNMLLDVTEQRKAEDKLLEYQEQLIESQRIAHIGSWQLNFDDHSEICDSPIKASEEAYRILGLGCKDKALSYGIFKKFIFPADKRQAQLAFLRALKTQSGTSGDFRIINDAKQVRWVRLDAKITRQKGTCKPLKMYGTLKDITAGKEHEIERQRNTKEKEQLIAELTKTNHDLKQFTYITSHNFKAPLSNLQALLELVDYTSLDEHNRLMIDMFKVSTLQLNSTINDLIEILIIKNNVHIQQELLQLPDYIEKAYTASAAGLNNLEAQLKMQLEVTSLRFNKTYLESILYNLISNACKYRSAKRPLEIFVRTYKNSEGNVVLSVSDNGLGIDLNRHEKRIFGLYQRFHENADGIGLGLFIIKNQINALGGTLKVESEVDKGSTFFVTFPASSLSEP